MPTLKLFTAPRTTGIQTFVNKQEFSGFRASETQNHHNHPDVQESRGPETEFPPQCNEHQDRRKDQSDAKARLRQRALDPNLPKVVRRFAGDQGTVERTVQVDQADRDQTHKAGPSDNPTKKLRSEYRQSAPQPRIWTA